ncbi:hypothetical protein [Streptomyces sp. WM6378]|uniref:hypothetical protein n=1 Tax=Streptomyces sp. WM6378 TaxID=1415557 RepID=UPI0006AF5CC7|nr:hypothetical protein [Streptomyces sp. WM6378]KOU51862.1 hypothetical protein ADK54_08660 [Streptomyces sp. WM6378]
MSVNCNTLFKLSLESLRDKKRLAGNAGLALLGATGDTYKAMELAEHGDGAASAGVYVASAEAKLRNASDLLGEVVSVLVSGSLSPDAITWYQGLDYDRLYRAGVDHGVLPQNVNIWAEFAELMVREGPLSVTEAFRARVAHAAELMTQWLVSMGGADSVTRLARLTAAVTDLAVYARFVGYVNTVEPLDKEWLRPVTATG